MPPRLLPFFPALALLYGLSTLSMRAFALEPKAVAPGADVTPELQSKIVQLFSAERCDTVRGLVRPDLLDQLRPSVRAIVAYCEPEGVDPEDVFASAEHDDPGADLVMFLHAKWTWLRDPERSYPLWDRVLELSRNESFRNMAERYLADEVTVDEPLHLQALNFEAAAKVGGGYETNPLFPLSPQMEPKRPQAFSEAVIDGALRHWYPFGSVALLYDGSYRRYLATPGLSLFDNTLGAPVNFRVGTYEDVGIRPFYGLSIGGSRAFGQRIGISVMGIAYRPDYRQSVQGSVFQERLYFPSLTPQEGTHYRFDYNWEFFPGQWNTKFNLEMEHVQAINDFSNGTNLKFSHTDIGSGFRVQYLQRGITYGGEIGAKMRLDDLASTWISSTTGGKLSKRRNDFTLNLRPTLSFPFNRAFAIDVSYELERTWSPIGDPGDYANYNILNQTAQVLLVTEFSNY